jgi:hypothetical protein
MVEGLGTLTAGGNPPNPGADSASLRSLFLCSPTRLNGSRNSLSSFGSKVPLLVLFPGTYWASRTPFGSCPGKQCAGMLEGGNFGVNEAENFSCVHADKCKA